MKMNKKISAALIAMLFVLGIVAVPVSAHFTMGNHTAAYPFRNSHFDPHVQGLIGYVFPGSGLITAGAGGFAGVPGWYYGAGTYPGYQSPWPYWTDGVNNPFPSQGPMGWYQLDANNYAPFGAILTSTIQAGTPFTTMWKARQWTSDNPTIESLSIEHATKGDLILAFNVTVDQKEAWKVTLDGKGLGDIKALNFTGVEILIPPEFDMDSTGAFGKGILSSQIITSWTNNYDNIGLSRRSREDTTYSPYWVRTRIKTDTVAFYGGTTNKAEVEHDDLLDDAPDDWLAPNMNLQFSPWKTFGNITFSLIQDNSNNYPDEWYYVRINNVVAPTIAGAYFFKFTSLSSANKYYDSATKKYQDLFGTKAYNYLAATNKWPTQNWPVVLVKGEVDPAIITGTIRYGGWSSTIYGQPVTLPGRVRAVGIADDPYTGKSTGRPVEARGYFDAAWCGHYEVEGVAAGVYDIYASAAGYPEIKIASNVRILKGQSYHVDGYLIPGVQIRGILFSKCGTGEVPFPYGLGDTVNPEYWGNVKIEIFRSIDDALAVNIAGPGASKSATWSPYGANLGKWGPTGFMKWEANPSNWGVGPSQAWTVTKGASSFNFQFGREGLYGAPCDLEGHVPGSVTPYWVSGLGAGTYNVRTYLFGYVQTLVDGVTFEPVTFTVPSVEWPGNIYVPFDIRMSSYVKKTVHFHDVPGTLMENPIGWGWNGTEVGLSGTSFYRFLAAELLDSAGKTRAWNVVPVEVSNQQSTIMARGFLERGTDSGYGLNYGIESGLYTVKAYMWGYLEQVFEKVNLGLCGTETTISDHLYRGAKFNLTVYSKDWQHPTADKDWSFPYMPIYIQIFNEAGTLVSSSSYWVMPQTMQGYENKSAAVWPYIWNNGYKMIENGYPEGEVGPEPAQPPYRKVGLFGPNTATYWYGARAYDGSEDYTPVDYVTYGCGAVYRPFSYESGVYSFKALTYGYVQKKPVAVYATKGNATSDILVKLTQGAELQLTMKFKHEGVFEGIPFDAHLRVRVINDQNKVVGEFLTSDWWWQPQYEWSPNTLRYTWNLVKTVPSTNIGNARADPPTGHRGWWRLNYVPQGTDNITVVIAGLPDMYNWYITSPCDPCKDTGAFSYDSATMPAPYGIDGYPNYQGGWKIQVHAVPVFDYYPGHYYNPVEVSTPTATYPVASTSPVGFEGMLMGELTYTADMKPVLVNHLGPYELRYDVVVPGTHLGGESSSIFELDRLGLITGSVFGYTYCDDWRTVSWTNVKFVGADNTAFDVYTFDGKFAAWLKPGPYTANVIFWSPSGQGYKLQTMPYHVSDGAFGAFNVYLEQSQVPIPEFPVAAIVLASALAASLFILRRKRK
jgi:hypothetical protein